MLDRFPERDNIEFLFNSDNSESSVILLSFFSDVNQGNKDFGCNKVGSRFSCVTPWTEMFSLDLPQTTKMNMTWR